MELFQESIAKKLRNKKSQTAKDNNREKGKSHVHSCVVIPPQILKNVLKSIQVNMDLS